MKQCHLQHKNCSFLPLQQWASDRQWIRSIQYIGKGLFVDYQSGLAELFDMTTNLSPYWNDLYVMSQYIVPVQKNNEHVSGSIAHQSRRDAIEL